MEAKENVQHKIEKSQFGGCTQNPPEKNSGVMVCGQCRTLFTWNCFLHFLFLVPYLLLVLLPFSLFIYRLKEEHNSGQQLNRVVTVLVTNWRSLDNTRLFYQPTGTVSAILMETRGQQS